MKFKTLTANSTTKTKQFEKLLEANGFDIIDIAQFLKSKGVKTLEWEDDNNFFYKEFYGSKTRFNLDK
jgi:hypothetical protein